MEYLEIVSPANVKSINVKPTCPVPPPAPEASARVTLNWTRFHQQTVLQELTILSGRHTGLGSVSVCLGLPCTQCGVWIAGHARNDKRVLQAHALQGK